jgi:hypothetical protein
MGFTQEKLAEHLGLERSTVARWEQGAGTPQPWNRPDLAKALNVSHERLEELLSDPVNPARTHDEQWVSAAEQLGSSDLPRRSVLGYGLVAAALPVLSPDAIPAELPTGSRWKSWAGATHDAVLNPMQAARRAAGPASAEDDLVVVRRAVNRAMHVSLTSDYAALERCLPTLIGQAEAATVRRDVPAAYQALSDIYAVAGWTLIKADHPTGAWIAAQRAIQAAEHADDVYRLAAATRCLAEVHMRADNFREATRTAFLATVHLEGTTGGDRPTMLALRGAALLSAAAASARRGDRREADAALRAAAVCATSLGQERSDLATVFGPTNVGIHQVAVAIELGEPDRAIRHIPAVDLERLPPALSERRSRFLIDVARSYAGVGDDGAALDALLQAETIAPDELRHHRLTRALVPQLLTREQRSSQLRALAGRCKLLD